jgi:hypothetical protein
MADESLALGARLPWRIVFSVDAGGGVDHRALPAHGRFLGLARALDRHAPPALARLGARRLYAQFPAAALAARYAALQALVAHGSEFASPDKALPVGTIDDRGGIRRAGGIRPAGAGPGWSRAEAVNRAYAGFIDLRATPHPNGLFVVEVPRRRHPGPVIEVLVRLFGERQVYLHGGPAPAPAADPRDLSFLAARRDGDLAGPAPRGLGFGELHARGVRGQNVRIVDVEQGFRVHPDLPPGMGDRILWGRSFGPPRELDHGTATLGLLGAQGATAASAARGFAGLAPDAELYFASPWSLCPEVEAHLGGCTCGRTGVTPCSACGRETLAALLVSETLRTGTLAGVMEYSVESAILGALFAAGADDRPVVRPGDVMLLEVQTPRYRLDDPLAPPALCPVQTEPGIATAMALAVAAGVVVVQAAGNAGLDIDPLVGGPMPEELSWRPGEDGRAVTDPIPGDVGAITVGGVAWDLGDRTTHDVHTRYGRYNHGTRVDTCGWGEGVLTLAGETASSPLLENFGGTSAGAAQVAAAVALLQSRILRGTNPAARPASAYGSPALRALLRAQGDVGVPSAPAAPDERGPVGETPDLRRLLRDALRLTEDVRFVTPRGPRGIVGQALQPALDAHGALAVRFRVELADRPAGATTPTVVVELAQGLPATLYCALAFGSVQRVPIPEADLDRDTTVTLTGAPPPGWPAEALRERCTPCLRGHATAVAGALVTDLGPRPAEYTTLHGAHYLLKHENNVRLCTKMVVRDPRATHFELPFWLVGDPDADREMVLSTQSDGFRSRVEVRFLDPLPEALVPPGQSASLVVAQPSTAPTALLKGVFPRGLRCRALLVVTAGDRDEKRPAAWTLTQTWLGDEVGSLTWVFPAVK